MPLHARRALGAVLPFAVAAVVLVVVERTGARINWAGGEWQPPALLGIRPSTDSTPEHAADDGASKAPPGVRPKDGAEVNPSAPLRLDQTTGLLAATPMALEGLFTVMDSLRGGRGAIVRIAHYGDSQIEGDRFTMHLRKALQVRFGSTGVGWVPIISEVAQFRVTVSQTFSNNWTQRDHVGAGAFQYGTGPGGLAFAPNGNEVGTTSYKVPTSFTSFAVGLSPGTDAARLGIAFDSGDSTALLLPPHDHDTVVVFQPRAPATSVRLWAQGPVALYGAWIGEGSGIAVDNFSRRGSSGANLTSIRGCAAGRTPAIGRYGLVILQFGINVLHDAPSAYGWYADQLRNVIATLRVCFPGTSVLVMGPSLRLVRDPLGLRESQGSLPLTWSLQRLAETEGGAFWDQGTAMRRMAALDTWANSGMLSPDLAHYSDLTSARLARQLAADLLRAYDGYRARGAKAADDAGRGKSPPHER